MKDQKELIPYNGLYWVVEDAIYYGEYKVKLWFRDGSIKVVDLESELWGEVFEPLRDLQEFAKVKYDPEACTIVWGNGADFAPEFLYERGIALSGTVQR